MKRRTVTAGGRSVGLLVLAIVVAAVSGSVISYFVSGVFPNGPVKDFFFKAVRFGVPEFVLNLGFATVSFGLSFYITTFTVLLVALAVYLWYRF
ncbi:MAG: DUF4321 domain-containing protein [candidate division WOR-3 bacterium]|nr:DUF4321 domain-containing protein [candidate division WOR-3 bacterium]